MIIGEWGFHKLNSLPVICVLVHFPVVQCFPVKNGVWAKDGNNFVYVRRIKDDAKLEDIYIYTFDDQRNLLI